MHLVKWNKEIEGKEAQLKDLKKLQKFTKPCDNEKPSLDIDAALLTMTKRILKLRMSMMGKNLGDKAL